MASILAGHDRAGDDVHRREHRRRAVPHVVMGGPRGSGGHQRKDRRGPIQRLHLRLLIHGQDQRVLRRRHVQPDDVTDLVHEIRVLGQLPRIHQMRLEAERPPDPADRGLVQALIGSHAPGRPVRVPTGGLTVQRPRDQGGDLLIGQLARLPRPRRILQAVQTVDQEPVPPLGHRRRTDPHSSSDISHRTRIRVRHHDLRSLHQPRRRRRPTDPPRQHRPLMITQHQRLRHRSRHDRSLSNPKRFNDSRH